MPARKPLKVFTRAQKDALVAQFLELRPTISLDALYQRTDLQGQIPGKRTLHRIQPGYSLRNETAHKLENLVNFLRFGDNSFAFDTLEGMEFYNYAKRALHIDNSHNIEFLRLYAGDYKCLRYTTNSSEILVTHLRIWSERGHVPSFRHTEKVPDEVSGLGTRQPRVILHPGYVFAKHRTALFISPLRGSFRQMSCVISSNPNHPTFSGILLAFDALYRRPFASRIFITKTKTATDIDNLPDEFGVFPPDRDDLQAFRKFIDNTVPSCGVLFPETAI